MKNAIQKVYCPKCQKLVRGQEQKNNEHHLELVCPKCNRVLLTRNSSVWRRAAEVSQ